MQLANRSDGHFAAGAVEEWAPDDEAMQAASALAEMAESTWAGMCLHTNILPSCHIMKNVALRGPSSCLFAVMLCNLDQHQLACSARCKMAAVRLHTHVLKQQKPAVP